jgi:hypothetical protein
MQLKRQASTVFTLLAFLAAVAGCGSKEGDSASSTSASTSAPSPAEAAQAALAQSVMSAAYQNKLVEDIGALSVEIADVMTKKQDRELTDDMVDPGSVRHQFACIQEGTNSFTCEHKMRGRYYQQKTQIDVRFDGTTGALVVKSETIEDGPDAGKTFPLNATDALYGR